MTENGKVQSDRKSILVLKAGLGLEDLEDKRWDQRPKYKIKQNRFKGTIQDF